MEGRKSGRMEGRDQVGEVRVTEEREEGWKEGIRLGRRALQKKGKKERG
jgi:hypothetical protein